MKPAIRTTGKTMMKEQGEKTDMPLGGLAHLPDKINQLEAEGEDLSRVKDSLLIIYQAIESTVNGIVITDLDSKITYMNPSVVAMFGIGSPDNLLGKEIAVLFPDGKMPPFSDPAALKERASHVTTELVLNKSDATTFYAELCVTDITDMAKRTIGRMFSFTNISKRKEAEKRLSLSEKQLRISNNTKDRLFSIIAHDLRNSLGSVVTHEEAILDDLMTPEEIMVFVRQLIRSAKGTFELLENLLSWARNHLDEIRFSPERVDVSKIIEKNLTLFHEQIKKKAIALHCIAEKEAYAFIDPDMINTVMRNLVSNAVKFTPRGGTVAVRLALAGDFLEISIADSGAGLSEENLKKVFRPDQHFSTPGTEGERGTGLGLMLCKEFIEKNGGVIRVESHPFRGATFSFTLPRKDYTSHD